MRASTPLRLLLAATTIAGTASVALLASSPAQAACSDIDIAFARGTFESAGLGSVGGPFVQSLTSDLSGRTVSSYAVNYAASADQSSAGPGATDLSNHVSSVAASCPNTRFVLGGYSQGATVTDIALGIRTGTTTGTPIPTALAPRVAAIVVFGNTLGAQGQTIATASPLYGARSKDYCNTGDPVCGGGNNTAAHLQYASNGSTTLGATFAANLVGSSTPPTTPPPTTPPTTPPPTTAPPTTPPTFTCVKASNPDQVAAGRATDLYGRAYAVGSRDYLGYDNKYMIVSLQQTAASSWSLVRSC